MDISFSRFGEFSFIPSLWYYFPSSVDANNLKVSSFHGVPKCTALFLFFFNFWLTFTEWPGSPPCHPVLALPQSLSAEEFAWFPECFVSSTTSVWLFSNNSISILNSIFISLINIFISSKSLLLFSWSIFRSSELFQHSYNLFFVSSFLLSLWSGLLSLVLVAVELVVWRAHVCVLCLFLYWNFCSTHLSV